MKVAIVHYHLGLGGVSHVIRATSRCLKRLKIEHVILVDTEPGEDTRGLPVQRVEGLGYQNAGRVGNVDILLDRLRFAAKDALGGSPDIWHFHNHSLGKTSMMAELVAKLADARKKLVLHIHDLAEDGRQQNYASIPDHARLYPTGENIEYVFLNERDRQVFLEHGMDKKRSRVMVNPVEIPEGGAEHLGGDPILFAPVRAIRRKNMGEMLFLAALAPAGAKLAISRGPSDPPTIAIHETWRKFAAHQRLPIGFDVVGRFTPREDADSSYESWVKHATHYMSTSVAESFGLTFLEAAAQAKPLIGRRIPHVDDEHKRHGINAGALYDQLLVPIDWVDMSVLRQHFDTSIARNYRYLGRQLSKQVIEESFASLVLDGWFDVGNMPEPVQQAVVERVADPNCKNEPVVVIGGEKLQARTWLREALANTQSSVQPKQLEVYSEKSYGESLKSLYHELGKARVGDAKYLEPKPILEAFLDPQNFHFLKSVIAPRPTTWSQYRAVIFDIYGTLLIAPGGGVTEANPQMDGLLQDVIDMHGFVPPDSPTQELLDAIKRHHEESEFEYPEVDLRVIWREILGLEPDADVTNLVLALESESRPTQPMPGAADFIRRLAHSGVSLGLLSNGQCNTLKSLGGIRDFFAPELSIISYQVGRAKPSPELFQLMTERLAYRGVTPQETLFIGNDPLQDIVPAAEAGFKTALFTGHPDSLRPGSCTPDHEINGWPRVENQRRRC